MKEISEESINKISESKLEAGRQKIICGFVKNELPEQSEVKLAIPTHRTREFISFEEFKSFIAQGKSLKELCIKYSKHLMAFYSYLSQGKVTLTKEQFIEEYEKGIPLDEIGRSHSIPREHITYLREYYGIKRKGANYQKRLKNEVPLSQEAKDVIIGSLLGDGHITPGGYFSEKHSEKQIEYLEWKAKLLTPILTPKSLYTHKYYDKRYGSTNYSFCLRTVTHSFIYEMRNKFYKEKNGEYIKTVPLDIEDMLTEQILAIWFMDDGNTDWKYRNGIKPYIQSRPCCKISSESFTLEENILLRDVLERKYNIIGNIHFREPRKYLKPYLKFNCDSSEKLINILKPYATSDLLYKFDEQTYLTHKDIIIDKDIAEKNFIEKHKIQITDIIKNED